MRSFGGYVLYVLLVAVLVLSGCKKSQPQQAQELKQQVPKPSEPKPAAADKQAKSDKVLLQFDIKQDLELIKKTSNFNEPPQFAIWLEDPESHKLQTVFVTYRTGSGDWVGKAECPDSLNRWYEVYTEETGNVGYPTPDMPAAAAVTGATPKADSFKVTWPVKPASKWICWLEMNLAGDFNEKYKQTDEVTKTIDTDFSGQPPLVYRAEITATPGVNMQMQLYGQSVSGAEVGQTVQPVSGDITTAKDVFKDIKISVVSSR